MEDDIQFILPSRRFSSSDTETSNVKRAEENMDGIPLAIRKRRRIIHRPYSAKSSMGLSFPMKMPFDIRNWLPSKGFLNRFKKTDLRSVSECSQDPSVRSSYVCSKCLLKNKKDLIKKGRQSKRSQSSRSTTAASTSKRKTKRLYKSKNYLCRYCKKKNTIKIRKVENE